MAYLRRIFLTGLVILVPVSISCVILYQLARFLDGILSPLFLRILKESYVRGTGIIALIVLILITGIIGSNLFGRRFVQRLNRFLEGVPLFNKLYATVKGISDSVLVVGKRKMFNGVALVPFPRTETRTIGFITSVPPELGKDLVGVFIPTPPNIVGGFYLIYEEKDIVRLNMSVQDALKLVISIGISSKDSETEDG